MNWWMNSLFNVQFICLHCWVLAESFSKCFVAICLHLICDTSSICALSRSRSDKNLVDFYGPRGIFIQLWTITLEKSYVFLVVRHFDERPFSGRTRLSFQWVTTKSSLERGSCKNAIHEVRYPKALETKTGLNDVHFRIFVFVPYNYIH